MNVLVVVPNWIGDVLMAQPLFRLLKREPGTRLVALAPAWVAPVLSAMTEIDAVIATELEHGRLQLRARVALAGTLRRQGFQRAFVLPNSLKSVLIPWMSGIPERIGYRGEARSWFLTRTLPDPTREVPMTERYARLEGLTPDPAEAPRLVIPQDRSEKAFRDFGLDPARPVLALCPGAEFGTAKQWPARHFARFAELTFASNPDGQLIIVGGQGDRAIAAEIVRASGAPIRDLAGQTNLGEAMALLSRCSGVVSNDSGLMHIAAALNRPQVALFGSTDPRHTPPASTRAQVLWLHLDCSPCFQRVCPLGHLNCLNQIEPEQVQSALMTATVS